MERGDQGAALVDHFWIPKSHLSAFIIIIYLYFFLPVSENLFYNKCKNILIAAQNKLHYISAALSSAVMMRRIPTHCNIQQQDSPLIKHVDDTDTR